MLVRISNSWTVLCAVFEVNCVTCSMTSQDNDLFKSKLSSGDNQQSPVTAPNQLIFLIADFLFKMWSSKQISLQCVQ